MALNILLLPGAGGNQLMWQDVAALLESDVKVHIATTPQGNCVKTIAENVLKNAPEDFIAIGFSLGGWTAIELAHLVPERVLGLGLISTTDGMMSPATIESMQKAQAMVRQLGIETVAERSMPLYFTEEDMNDNHLMTRFKQMMMEVGAATLISQYQVIIDFKRPFAHLTEINCPTLIIRGEKDQRTPFAISEALHQAISLSGFNFIQDAPH